MKEEAGHKRMLVISGKEAVVYPAAVSGRPVIYLNSPRQEGDQVYHLLAEMGYSDFSLVAISGLDWHHDMTPWEMPPVSKKAPPCTGGGGEYLHVLTQDILPRAEAALPGPVSWRGLAGYSLAGLFAIYAACRTRTFSRIASMSGSLWFPDFKEYVFSHEPTGDITHMYLSLGSRECRTGNPYMKTVQERTEEIAAHYAEKGIDTVFRLNPGNHFKDTVRRTAAGIAWMLDR